MVIEKALAKVYGSYEAIESGKPYQAFMTLCGFPSDIIFNNKMAPKVLWEYLLEATKSN